MPNVNYESLLFFLNVLIEGLLLASGGFRGGRGGNNGGNRGGFRPSGSGANQAPLGKPRTAFAGQKKTFD